MGGLIPKEGFPCEFDQAFIGGDCGHREIDLEGQRPFDQPCFVGSPQRNSGHCEIYGFGDEKRDREDPKPSRRKGVVERMVPTKRDQPERPEHGRQYEL